MIATDGAEPPFETLKVLIREDASSNKPERGIVANNSIILADRSEPDSCAASYLPTDAGRAQQFIDRHLETVRYVPKWGIWLIWSGNHWRADCDGEISRLVIKHGKELLAKAALLDDFKQCELAAKEAMALGNASRIKSLLQLAKIDSRIIVCDSDLDSNPALLGVKNGVIDLLTCQFRPGLRADLITKQAGVTYEQNATCPRWLQFIEEISAGDGNLARYLQKWIAYSLTGYVKEQCFAFLYGDGDNGKSIFIEILHALTGDYGMSAPLSLIALSPNGREPSADLASLQGARFVVGPELEQGMRLAESRIKDLTGGDTISARRLYQASFNFKPRAKLWLFGNHKPEITGMDSGIWRRVRLIPFTVKIPENLKDKNLGEKLRAELPGILLWALEGVSAWNSEGLNSPKCVDDAVKRYKSEEDTIADFLHSETQQVQGARVKFQTMFGCYLRWAADNSMPPLNSRAFAGALRQHGIQDSRSNGASVWLNVKIVDSSEQKIPGSAQSA